MEKEQAIQEINYIRDLMRETQQVVDTGWPILIYWGIYVLSKILLYNLFVDPEALKRPEMSLSYIIHLFEQFMFWAGFLMMVVYIIQRRNLISNPKMYLLGGIALVYITSYILLTIGYQIILSGLTSWEPYASLFKQMHLLFNGLYFGSLFLIMGLLYAREQFWMGYFVMAAALADLILDVTRSPVHLLPDQPGIFWCAVGIAFLLSGIFAYRRQKGLDSGAENKALAGVSQQNLVE